MAGQIIARGKGVWLVRVYLGTDPATGKREYHNKTIHGNKKAAEADLTDTLHDRDRGKLSAGGEWSPAQHARRPEGAGTGGLHRDGREAEGGWVEGNE